jgi:hypothetical protein
MDSSKQSGSKNVDFKKFAFLQCLDDLQFKYIFHKQSGSEIKVKAGSRYGSEKNNFGSTTLIAGKQKTMVWLSRGIYLCYWLRGPYDGNGLTKHPTIFNVSASLRFCSTLKSSP